MVFKIKIQIWKDEDNRFVIEAKDYPIFSDGKTKEEALNNFIDAFNTCISDSEWVKINSPKEFDIMTSLRCSNDSSINFHKKIVKTPC
jgi:predicted RNase H-like HicB family nuclease